MKVALLALVLMVTGCGGGCGAIDYHDWVDSRAEAYYTEHGFKIVGYQGYNIVPHGRCYWYTLERQGKVWQSCLMRWNDEIHEYDLTSLEALKGGN